MLVIKNRETAVSINSRFAELDFNIIASLMILKKKYSIKKKNQRQFENYTLADRLYHKLKSFLLVALGELTCNWYLISTKFALVVFVKMPFLYVKAKSFHDNFVASCTVGVFPRMARNVS
ncbi:hypothetical protein HX837_03735, partial [Marine Group I thaumarchaeote]|nr:hypothetical protein [Marine Group I thaumarchaeote]